MSIKYLNFLGLFQNIRAYLKGFIILTCFFDFYPEKKRKPHVFAQKETKSNPLKRKILGPLCDPKTLIYSIMSDYLSKNLAGCLNIVRNIVCISRNKNCEFNVGCLCKCVNLVDESCKTAQAFRANFEC